jgi:hypothetical protein
MSELKPPAVAAWLLGLTDSSTWNYAVAGDLSEEYQQRRSPKWYWRQVLTILGIGVLKDLRIHWVLALRALAVAVGSIIIFQRLHLASRLLDGAVAAIGLGPYLVIVAALEPFLICAPAGLAVALTHRKRQATMVLVYTAALLVFLVCLCANRAHWTAACVLFWESAAFAVAGALVGGFLGCAWVHPPSCFRTGFLNGIRR